MMSIVSDDSEPKILMYTERISEIARIIIFEQGEFYYADLLLRGRPVKGWKSRSYVSLKKVIEGFIEGVSYGQQVLLQPKKRRKLETKQYRDWRNLPLRQQ